MADNIVKVLKNSLPKLKPIIHTHAQYYFQFSLL